MGHDLGAHHALFASDKLNLVFGRLLQDVRGRLAVVLCQFRQVIVQSGPQVELDLFSRFLGHWKFSSHLEPMTWQNRSQV
jgi:hypothetical protein